MAVRDPNADRDRQRGAIRGLVTDVPLPRRVKGRITWDSLVTLIKEADDDTSGRYSSDERHRIHTARLLAEGRHPTQRMGKDTAQRIGACLVEFHGNVRRVEREWT